MSDGVMKLVGSETAESRSGALTGRWLPIQVAADRAKLNVGALRRMVVEQGWVASGRARQAKQTSGQMAYEVDEGADPRFAHYKTAEVLTDAYRTSRDFLGLPQVIRDRALQRESMVQEWQRRVAAGRTLRLTEVDVTKRYVIEQAGLGVEVGRASLFNWAKALKTSGLKGLVDEWGKHKSADTLQFWQLASEIWLHPNKRSAQYAYDIAGYQAQQHGWETMSYRDFTRKLKGIPAVVRIKRRDGEDAFVAQAEPSIARDYSSVTSNEWWCSDDHTLDVMVHCGNDDKGEPVYKRPYLHAWQDLRSRKIIAWAMLADAPRASDVLRTFVTAVREYGAPHHVLVDNGKTYDSRQLQGITKHQRRRGANANALTDAEVGRMGGAFRVLGCTVHHAREFHGQSKPIERQFGTLCSRFSKLWEAYTGNSPENKPGKGNGTNATQRALDRGDVLTLAEMRSAFEAWLANDYNGKAGHRGDSMDGRSPDEAYAAELVKVRRVPEDTLEFATFERVGPLKVHKNGVTWKTQQYGWAKDELVRRLGQEVMLAIDERDATHVLVLDLNGSLVCRADANQKLPWGADKRLMEEATTLKKRARRVSAEYQKQRTRLTMDVADLAFVASADRKARHDAAAPPADNPPPSVQPVFTPFDLQSKAIAAAFETVQAEAVGAESITSISMSKLMGNRREDSDELDR